MNKSDEVARGIDDLDRRPQKNVQCREGQATSVTGNKLFTASYVPEGEAPAALLVLHHGLAEHIGRYRPSKRCLRLTAPGIKHLGIDSRSCLFLAVAEALASRGIAVYLHDAFGHGKSDGERIFFGSMDPFVADFNARRKAAQDELASAFPDTEIPTFIGGHSMGGLVTVLAAQADPEGLAGVLVMSPALGAPPGLSTSIQTAVGSVLAHVLPRLKVPVVDPVGLNKDPRLVEEYMVDPLNTVKPPPIKSTIAMIKVWLILGNYCLEKVHEPSSAWESASNTHHEGDATLYHIWNSCLYIAPIIYVLQGMKAANAGAAAMTVPLYMHHGDVDTVTYEPATKKFYEAAVGCKDKVYTSVQGGYHEILLGPEKESTIEAIGDWILARSPSRAKL